MSRLAAFAEEVWATWTSLDARRAEEGRPTWRWYLGIALTFAAALLTREGCSQLFELLSWVIPERLPAVWQWAAPALANALGYGAAVAVGARVFLGMRPAQLGLGRGQTRAHLGEYAWVFGLSLCAIVPASFFGNFQAVYPQYPWIAASWWDFVSSEALVGLGLLAVEIFFRGFILSVFAREYGRWGPLLATVPYCLLHAWKPGPELLGAFFYGLLLDTLAVRARSIWGGWCVHFGMALTMDALAMAHRGMWGKLLHAPFMR